MSFIRRVGAANRESAPDGTARGRTGLFLRVDHDWVAPSELSSMKTIVDTLAQVGHLGLVCRRL
jgi:hypothetical protein